MECSSGGSRILWVGGDGSTRIYEPPVPGAWGTWTAQRPDLLRTLAMPGSVTETMGYDRAGRLRTRTESVSGSLACSFQRSAMRTISRMPED